MGKLSHFLQKHSGNFFQYSSSTTGWENTLGDASGLSEREVSAWISCYHTSNDHGGSDQDTEALKGKSREFLCHDLFPISGYSEQGLVYPGKHIAWPCGDRRVFFFPSPPNNATTVRIDEQEKSIDLYCREGEGVEHRDWKVRKRTIPVSFDLCRNCLICFSKSQLDEGSECSSPTGILFGSIPFIYSTENGSFNAICDFFRTPFPIILPFDLSEFKKIHSSYGCIYCNCPCCMSSKLTDFCNFYLCRIFKVK